jgi:hypothetical protein
VHTVIFWVLSSCVVYALLSGATDRITTWTWIALGAVVLEGGVLLAFGGVCPLTLLAERRGAVRRFRRRHLSSEVDGRSAFSRFAAPRTQ